jgi:hypothetical protein
MARYPGLHQKFVFIDQSQLRKRAGQSVAANEKSQNCKNHPFNCRRLSMGDQMKSRALALLALLLMGAFELTVPSYAQSDQLGTPSRDGDDDSVTAKRPQRRDEDKASSPADRLESATESPARERDRDNLGSNRDDRERNRRRGQ